MFQTLKAVQPRETARIVALLHKFFEELQETERHSSALERTTIYLKSLKTVSLGNAFVAGARVESAHVEQGCGEKGGHGAGIEVAGRYCAVLNLSSRNQRILKLTGVYADEFTILAILLSSSGSLLATPQFSMVLSGWSIACAESSSSTLALAGVVRRKNTADKENQMMNTTCSNEKERDEIGRYTTRRGIPSPPPYGKEQTKSYRRVDQTTAGAHDE